MHCRTHAAFPPYTPWIPWTKRGLFSFGMDVFFPLYTFKLADPQFIPFYYILVALCLTYSSSCPSPFNYNYFFSLCARCEALPGARQRRADGRRRPAAATRRPHSLGDPRWVMAGFSLLASHHYITCLNISRTQYGKLHFCNSSCHSMRGKERLILWQPFFELLK